MKFIQFDIRIGMSYMDLKFEDELKVEIDIL